MYVFVIGLDGTRLMPCKPRKARKLIEAHKAEIYKKQPFTIRLLYKTGCATQPVTIGIDTGSQHIGIAVISALWTSVHSWKPDAVTAETEDTAKPGIEVLNSDFIQNGHTLKHLLNVRLQVL